MYFQSSKLLGQWYFPLLTAVIRFHQHSTVSLNRLDLKMDVQVLFDNKQLLAAIQHISINQENRTSKN